jgi:hypothetical protein
MNEMILDMPADEYHSSAGISKHGLDLINRAPALYRHQKLNPVDDPTPAMRFGTLAHLMILEPDKFSSETFLMPACDRRTKEGKEIYASAMRAAAGRMVITPEELEQLKGMQKAICEDKACSNALSNIKHVEASLYWIDQLDDVACRARLDAIKENGMIVDYKTTDNASPEAFLRTVLNFRYHVQAAFYLDGLKAITGQEGTFVLVAQEKKAPYLCCVYIVGDDLVEKGRQEYRKDLGTYKQCVTQDTWEGISSHPLELHLPRWMNKSEPIEF